MFSLMMRLCFQKRKTNQKATNIKIFCYICGMEKTLYFVVMTEYEAIVLKGSGRIFFRHGGGVARKVKRNGKTCFTYKRKCYTHHSRIRDEAIADGIWKMSNARHQNFLINLYRNDGEYKKDL